MKLQVTNPDGKFEYELLEYISYNLPYKKEVAVGFTLVLTVTDGFLVKTGIARLAQEKAIQAGDIAAFGAIVPYEVAFAIFGTEMIAVIYSQAGNSPFEIKYNKVSHKALYKITQT
jgi:hypothetical protein